MPRIPRSQRHGTEPDDAVTDLPLRRALSRWALIAGIIAAAACSWAAATADQHRGVWIFAAAVSAATAAIATVDLAVIRKRIRQGRIRLPHQR